MRGPALSPDEYVDAMVRVAEGDASIGRVLREILSIDGAVRSSALDLVAAHLRVHSAGDVPDCIDMLKRAASAQRLGERHAALTPAPGGPATPPPV